LPGVTKSMKKRFQSHSRSFRNGEYYILHPEQASKGVREVLWDWKYSENKEEFEKNKNLLLKDVEKQLVAMRIFVAEIPSLHLKERMEGALIKNLYGSNESWAKLADRGMHYLDPKPSDKGYYGQPIIAENVCSAKIYGLPDKLKVD